MTGEDEARAPLRLFEGYGVELEYMLVDPEDLTVRSVSDEVLRDLAGGEIANEVEVESVSWSNEFVMHVVELKNTDPVPALAPLADLFAEHVSRMNARLASSAPSPMALLPGAMHPFMRPRDEARIWPHDGREIYDTFHRIFDCKRHGWANLQSVQLNLSFGDDDEFGKLHAAVRALLPVLPALAASSPVLEGEVTGLADTRLEVYRTNSERVPAVTGAVIPEAVFSRRDYEAAVFEPMYAAIEPLDPEGILRHPWLNARGAIAQFPRDAIEIRVLDMQECPRADVAICAVAAAVARALVTERWTDGSRQRGLETGALAGIFRKTLAEAELAVIDDRDLLEVLGFPDRKARADELWVHLRESLEGSEPAFAWDPMRVIFEEGPLARRITRALGPTPSRGAIAEVYQELRRCLEDGVSFVP